MLHRSLPETSEYANTGGSGRSRPSGCRSSEGQVTYGFGWSRLYSLRTVWSHSTAARS